MATLTIEAGALVRRSLRVELERLKFLGYQITWHEGRLWHGSTFTVKGPAEVIIAIHKCLKDAQENPIAQ